MHVPPYTGKYYHSTLPSRQLRPRVGGWPSSHRKQMEEHSADFLTPSTVLFKHKQTEIVPSASSAY